MFSGTSAQLAHHVGRDLPISRVRARLRQEIALLASRPKLIRAKAIVSVIVQAT